MGVKLLFRGNVLFLRTMYYIPGKIVERVMLGGMDSIRFAAHDGLSGNHWAAQYAAHVREDGLCYATVNGTVCIVIPRGATFK